MRDASWLFFVGHKLRIGQWHASYERKDQYGKTDCNLVPIELDSGADTSGTYMISVKLGQGEYGRAKLSVAFTEDDLLQMLREVHSAEALHAERQNKLKQRRERQSPKKDRLAATTTA